MTNVTTIEQPDKGALEIKQQEWLAKHDLTTEIWSALQSSIYPGARPESILLVCQYCKARDLDPLKKPVHIVPMKVKDARTGDYSWRDVVMPGIYEYRITAMRTGEYVGMDEPEFGDSIEYRGIKAPEWCRITVYRLIDGARCPFPHQEWFEECVGTKQDGEPNAMWRKRPKGQLLKCCEAGALRKAFPEDLGGTMTADEVDGGQQAIDITPTNEADDINAELGIN